MSALRFVREVPSRGDAFRTVAVVVVCACFPGVVACGTTASSIGAGGAGTPPASTDASSTDSTSTDASIDAVGEMNGRNDGSATGEATGEAEAGTGGADGGFGDGTGEGGGSTGSGGGTTDGGGLSAVCDGAGTRATSCFSTGDWAVDNVEPCFITTTDGVGNAIATAYASTPGSPVQCGLDPNTGDPIVPGTWSTDTLQVDCSGVFALCFTLKAGDGTHPQAGDCVVAQTCTAAHYGPAESTMVFPPLPGWSSSPDQSACTAAFVATGGYGEMSVSGQTDACESVQRVFQTVVYCPTSCGSPDAPSQCATCVAGGGGAF